MIIMCRIILWTKFCFWRKWRKSVEVQLFILFLILNFHNPSGHSHWTTINAIKTLNNHTRMKKIHPRNTPTQCKFSFANNQEITLNFLTFFTLKPSFQRVFPIGGNIFTRTARNSRIICNNFQLENFHRLTFWLEKTRDSRRAGKRVMAVERRDGDWLALSAQHPFIPHNIHQSVWQMSTAQLSTEGKLEPARFQSTCVCLQTKYTCSNSCCRSGCKHKHKPAQRIIPARARRSLGMKQQDDF